MEEKINIAKLLKDCPKGMGVDCVLYNDVVLHEVHLDDRAFPIVFLRTTNGDTFVTTKYGQYQNTVNGKCIVFPKGKTTWEGFVPPCNFKDADIISMENACGCHTFIYNNITDEYGSYGYYAIITSMGNFKVNNFCSGSKYRLANEEEKEKLFQAIKDNGYKWNAETKTLEKLIKPKFKVRDIIKHKEKTR